MSADTTPAPDTTWDAVPLYHPWCPVDRPYPESYDAARAEDPARCVAEDPCLAESGTTLWTIQPCTVESAPTTTAVAGVLPATGLDVPAPMFGGALFAVGLVLLRVSARRRPKQVERSVFDPVAREFTETVAQFVPEQVTE